MIKKKMSEFRTVIKLGGSDVKISYNSVLLFMGSCFSESIGEKFTERRFNAMVNPFGILYNPVSVKQSIEILLKKVLFDDDMLFENEGLWHSFYHHSRFSSPDKKRVVENINKSIIEGHEILKKADFLFITFGTAWVYENLTDGKIVANCHKLPASKFRRFRLKVDDIVEGYTRLLESLGKFNPNLNIVFTVSPVRHWKDGAHGNQLSKSVLLLAIDELANRYSNVSYFPSYELVMDDLRDYRFYAEDMLHPGSLAVDYIWNRLSETFFDAKAKEFVKEIEKVMKAVKHRPFNSGGEEFRRFVKRETERLKSMETQYPGVDMTEYLEYFMNIS